MGGWTATRWCTVVDWNLHFYVRLAVLLVEYSSACTFSSVFLFLKDPLLRRRPRRDRYHRMSCQHSHVPLCLIEDNTAELERAAWGRAQYKIRKLIREVQGETGHITIPEQNKREPGRLPRRRRCTKQRVKGKAKNMYWEGGCQYHTAAVCVIGDSGGHLLPTLRSDSVQMIIAFSSYFYPTKSPLQPGLALMINASDPDPAEAPFCFKF